MTNSTQALDLYAKIEDLIGVKEVAPKLYRYYLDILDNLEFNSLLDIGCGSGDFLTILKKRYKNCYFQGIDRSNIMVNKARKRGLNVYRADVKDIQKEFDIATATFDMVNYLEFQEIKKFFKNLETVIKKGGYFIFDVNTEYGLSELAVGNFVNEDKYKLRFLVIESFYKHGIYQSYFTLFNKKSNRCYERENGKIEQYLHTAQFFNNLKGWVVKDKTPISLYEAPEYDKIVYLLQKI